jgi:flagellar motor switch protein FliN/FliY
MEIAEILKLGQGSVLELDSIADQPLELWVNDQFIAKVLPVISHDKVGAQIQEIASKEQRMREITLQSDE